MRRAEPGGCGAYDRRCTATGSVRGVCGHRPVGLLEKFRDRCALYLGPEILKPAQDDLGGLGRVHIEEPTSSVRHRTITNQWARLAWIQWPPRCHIIHWIRVLSGGPSISIGRRDPPWQERTKDLLPGSPSPLE